MAQGLSWDSRSSAVQSQGLKSPLHLDGEKRFKSPFPPCFPLLGCCSI